MGEVAVMHSEPLQLECYDMNHMTENEVRTPKSNEPMPEEESNQSTDDINMNDLQEKGYMEHGCQHYRRRCLIRAPCCDEIFDCHHCHNEAKNDTKIDHKHRHNIPRHQVKQVICSLCGTEQEVQPNCINCGVCMGKYFCETCKLFDDDISKQQYHCDECGICRTGGRENNFHCDKCGCCYSILLKNSHPCVERAMHHDCPICCEYLFETTKDILVLPCGHTIHKICLDEMRKHLQYACPLCSKSVYDMSKVWEKLDLEIAATPMPPPYRNKMVSILCNDCCKYSENVKFHFVGHKCLHCNSYNTRQTSGHWLLVEGSATSYSSDWFLFNYTLLLYYILYFKSLFLLYAKLLDVIVSGKRLYVWCMSFMCVIWCMSFMCHLVYEFYTCHLSFLIIIHSSDKK